MEHKQEMDKLEKDQRIAGLEAKIAESESKAYTLESYNNFLNNQCKKLIKENKELKQQLAESEKELLEIKQRIAEKASKEFQEMIDKRETHNQDKILFAVEQLEKVKEKVEKRNNGTKHGHCSVEYKDGYRR